MTSIRHVPLDVRRRRRRRRLQRLLVASFWTSETARLGRVRSKVRTHTLGEAECTTCGHHFNAPLSALTVHVGPTL